MTTTPLTPPSVPLGLPTLRSGTHGVPALPEGVRLGKKDFTSDSEVRWCPGCGDYAVLAAVQGFLPELGLRKENVVFISGIGCSSRFPYYLDTYGMHSIHGRAPAIATGLVATRPDLSVFVVTGDGDALSIGGNHLIHAMRRNVNVTILLFNNRIYGLTKGQYSPTSEVGKVTKSTPSGSLDAPFNPVSLALGAEASFVARTLDSDRKHLTSVLRAAAEHRGTSLVEIYQNCPIFNDGAFDVLKDRDESVARLVKLEHGQEVVFGAEGSQKAVVRSASGFGVEVIGLDEARASGREVIVHDAETADPSLAFALSRLDEPTMAHVPVGVFRAHNRPTYDDEVRTQLDAAREASGRSRQWRATDADLEALLRGSDTWSVE
ncbi:2-oxoglutarate ferredoxin oxidoreductase subunit beta [Quadrisphaera granulorum]|uniref:2-oxoglutarate ferredoxin oxidoreductase subunit beta n=1 Tax=Quadrisphaera granulorum TaxID=317664 RepID=A0A316ACZ0_9ACTN|nr:2-oxoacid:ferredoxin oxidoreductase subunit beta [Quadrisphaera granulorum]PWJ55501.1 2-oxoglutarate ferredoxin oxidoreductase subunit beta [Quadrisphaera granulorum]SZE95565.1 2-oxoglutarate ferredoxin oxidoreductase subunit beta [Quadrisphaera granulorum]